MKKSRLHRDAKGFTIIETLIATAVFSVVLLVCSFAVMQIGRMYYKSLLKVSTQQAARALGDTMSQQIRLIDKQPAIQFRSIAGTLSEDADGILDVDGGKYIVCIGSVQYYVQLNRQLKETPSASTNDRQSTGSVIVRQADNTNCVPPAASVNSSVVDERLWTDKTSFGGGTELMVPNARLAYMSIKRYSITNRWTLVLNVASGDQDTLDQNPTNLDSTQCKSTSTSSQFCSTSRLETVILRRT